MNGPSDSPSPTAASDAGTVMPVADSPEARAERPLWRTLAQAGGFLGCLGLLGWCLSLAFSPQTRAHLEHLGDATPGESAALLGLALLSLVVNGVIFWAALLPVRRLPPRDVVATNFVATLLGYLPFKLSVVGRALIHHRRDGLALTTIGAWISAIVVNILATLGPLGVASLALRRIDGAWLGLSALGLGLGVGSTVLAARWLHGDSGLRRVHASVDALRLGILSRVVRGGRFRELHAGLAMLSHPGPVGACMALRVADIAALTLRFYVSGAIVGAPLTLEQSGLIASAYFMISLLSPFGVLGAREAGVVGLGAMLGVARPEAIAVVALVVSAGEAIVNVSCGVLGLAWLRPDRLLRRPGAAGGRRAH